MTESHLSCFFRTTIDSNTMEPASYSSTSSAMTLLSDNATSSWRFLTAVKNHILHQADCNDSMMGATYQNLAAQAVSLLIEKQHQQSQHQHQQHEPRPQSRIIIALAGTPGSGKTTLATRVGQILNEAYSAVLNKSVSPTTSTSSATTTTANGASADHFFYENSNGNLSSSTLASEYSDGSYTSSLVSATATPTMYGSIPIHANDAAGIMAHNNNSQQHSLPNGNYSSGQPNPVTTSLMLDDSIADLDGPNHPSTPTYFLHSLGSDPRPPRCFPTLCMSSPPLPTVEPTTTAEITSNTTITPGAAIAAAPIHFATTVPMDGYHLFRKELDCMDNPDEAHKRRGAPWTFDAEGVVTMAQQLHQSCFVGKAGSGLTTTTAPPPPLLFPGFDHARKDPQPDAVVVPSSAKIVIIEGLYTLLSTDPWVQVSQVVDLRWFIHVPLQTARARLARRHLSAGIVGSLQEGFDRVDSNDALNARFIVDHQVAADCIIESINDDISCTFT